MAVVTDTFTRDDTPDGLGTAESGHIWVPQQSFEYVGGATRLNLVSGADVDYDLGVEPLEVVGNAVGPNDPADDRRIRWEAVNLGTPDLHWNFDIILVANRGPGNEAEAILRAEDSSHFLVVLAVVRTTNSGQIVFYLDRHDGVELTQIAQVLGPASAATGDLNIDITLAGDDVTILARITTAGAHFGTYWDATYSVPEVMGTTHGLGMRHWPGNELRIDDLNVTYTPGTPLRLFPRDDGLTNSARLFPPPTSHQSSIRLHPSYD